MQYILLQLRCLSGEGGWERMNICRINIQTNKYTCFEILRVLKNKNKEIELDEVEKRKTDLRRVMEQDRINENVSLFNFTAVDSGATGYKIKFV